MRVEAKRLARLNCQPGGRLRGGRLPGNHRLRGGGGDGGRVGDTRLQSRAVRRTVVRRPGRRAGRAGRHGNGGRARRGGGDADAHPRGRIPVGPRCHLRTRAFPRPNRRRASSPSQTSRRISWAPRRAPVAESPAGRTRHPGDEAAHPVLRGTRRNGHPGVRAPSGSKAVHCGGHRGGHRGAGADPPAERRRPDPARGRVGPGWPHRGTNRFPSDARRASWPRAEGSSTRLSARLRRDRSEPVHCSAGELQPREPRGPRVRPESRRPARREPARASESEQSPRE